MRAQILAHSAVGNPLEWSSPHDVRLDSRGGIRRWRERLSEQQIERVRTMTEDVWRHYYSDDDWDGEADGVLRAAS